jgi:DNA adenine methylase
MQQKQALFEIKKEWGLDIHPPLDRKPPKQLLKWIGNKQRFAQVICSFFPLTYNKYIEPFVGSGAVLGAMAPTKGIAGDALRPLIQMWNILQKKPGVLNEYYETTWKEYSEDPKKTYKKVLDSYNKNPNPLDLVFISRSCYGGVVRFTKEGRMSTPLGPHKAISPESFKERMMLWRARVKNTQFLDAGYQETMKLASTGDVIYCDPPYSDSQTILYGAQSFKLAELFGEIAKAKYRGAKIALSIDGHKKSGAKIIELNIPKGIFERELLINNGSSMLKRFQKKDEVMIGEDVHDRLLLTW